MRNVPTTESYELPAGTKALAWTCPHCSIWNEHWILAPRGVVRCENLACRRLSTVAEAALNPIPPGVHPIFY